MVLRSKYFQCFQHAASQSRQQTCVCLNLERKFFQSHTKISATAVSIHLHFPSVLHRKNSHQKKMPSLSSPTQSMDTVYPEPMSRLYRRAVPKKRRNRSFRYRTQPVTFSEIQEVDEENVDDSTTVADSSSSSKSELNLLNLRFEEFKRSRDLLFKNDCEIDCDINEKDSSCRTMGKLPSRPSF